MKLRSPLFLYVLAVMLVAAFAGRSNADTLQWQTPIGLVNLNLKTTETLIGYDGILKQALGGIDLPVYTTPKNIATLKLGADAPWQTNGATIEPMVLAGHNILGDIPAMAAYPQAQINVFGRYSPEQGKAGAGIAFTYQPGATPAATSPSASAAPMMPLASRLSLFRRV